MTTLVNTLVGPAGTDIDNTSSVGGGDAFNETDGSQITGTGSLTFATLGTRGAMRAQGGATSSTARRGWSVPTAATTQYVRFYFDPGQVVAPLAVACRGMDDTSATQRFRLCITSSGVFVTNNANTTVWNSSATLNSGTTYRVEMMIQGSTTGQYQVKIFLDETTAVVEDSGVRTSNFGGPIQSVWYGAAASSTNYNFLVAGPVGWSDTTWLGPAAAAGPTLVTHLATGIPTDNGVTISQKWNSASGKSIRLVVSTNVGLTSPVYGSLVTIDSKGWAKPSITGLSADTDYFGGVEVDGTLQASGRFRFHTAPTANTAETFGIFFGSGRQTGGGDEAFLAMVNAINGATTLQGRPAFLADLGDNGAPAWGSPTEDQVLDHLVAQSQVANTQSLAGAIPWTYALGAQDSGTDKSGGWKAPVLAAYKRAFPHRGLNSSSGALYQSWDWGRVRFILPDNRSERDNPALADDFNKRMWSQEQEDWFISRCKSWQGVICVLSSTPARLDAPADNRWGAYSTQFDRINDRLQAADCLRRVVWLSGGRNAVATSDGSHLGTRGNPQAIGSPFEQTSRDLPAGETWNTYYNVTPNALTRAYGEAAFTDAGANSVTFDFRGRTSDGTQRATMTKTLDVTKRVNWTSPKGIETFYVPPVDSPTHKVLFGMTTLPADTAQMVTDFPGIKYMRSFGKDSNDADTLPELAMPGTEKWLTKPSDCILHCSWKDDVEQLSSFMTALVEPVYLTWYHEPMGDVSPATYQATGARITEIINAHAKKSLILGHGPCVTRFWLDEGGGNPDDWAYPGMTHYMVDTYNGAATEANYKTPEKMFGYWLDLLRTKYPGIRFLVPEWGIVKINSDASGNGRADAIRAQAEYARQQPDLDAVCWFNTTVGVGQKVAPDDPAGIALKEIMALQ